MKNHPPRKLYTMDVEPNASSVPTVNVMPSSASLESSASVPIASESSSSSSTVNIIRDDDEEEDFDDTSAAYTTGRKARVAVIFGYLGNRYQGLQKYVLPVFSSLCLFRLSLVSLPSALSHQTHTLFVYHYSEIRVLIQ